MDNSACRNMSFLMKIKVIIGGYIIHWLVLQLEDRFHHWGLLVPLLTISSLAGYKRYTTSYDPAMRYGVFLDDGSPKV